MGRCWYAVLVNVHLKMGAWCSNCTAPKARKTTSSGRGSQLSLSTVAAGFPRAAFAPHVAVKKS